MVRKSPTVQLLLLFALVYVVLHFGSNVGIPAAWLILTEPMERPWTLVTSVYAHAGIPHLVGNAIGLAIVGFALERSTSEARFHGFFLGTGALAGLAQVSVSEILGQEVAVLGASGAILALFGYVVTSNPVSATLFGIISVSRVVLLVIVSIVALGFTLLTAAPGVALVAHFVGLVLGMLSGRARLLRVENATLK